MPFVLGKQMARRSILSFLTELGEKHWAMVRVFVGRVKQGCHRFGSKSELVERAKYSSALLEEKKVSGGRKKEKAKGESRAKRIWPPSSLILPSSFRP
jgi:hypothetical protein